MLTLVSLAYLALPSFIFAVTWLRWPYAVAVSATLAAGLAVVARQVIARDRPSSSQDRPRAWLDRVTTGGLLLFMIVISGIGRFGFQRSDWLKHNAILHDLSTMSWPVTYGGGPDAGLTYYLAYYLPAAQVGRWSDIDAAHLALFVWSAIGLGLAAAWLFRLVGSRSWLVAAGWLALSGMDVVGAALVGGSLRHQMQSWAELAQYSSNPTLLFWAPQHALPGWIATAITVDWLERHRSALLVGLCAALVALWSPFITIGLLPLLVLGVARVRFRGLLTFPNLVAAPPLLLVCAAYLSSLRLVELPHEWCWESLGWRGALGYWLAFCVLEFGLYLALVVLLWRRAGPDAFRRAEWTPTWLAAAGATLYVLPLYRLGLYNDLAMRASIPALFVLWLLLLRVRWTGVWRAQPVLAQILLVSLALGAIQPLYDIAVQVKKTRRQSVDRRLPANLTVLELRPELKAQYLGDLGSPFFRHLARLP